MNTGAPASSTNPATTGLSTLQSLVSRLERLEYLLNGSTNYTGRPERAENWRNPDETVVARLAQLEKQLRRLQRDNALAREVLALRMYFAASPKILAGLYVSG